MSDNQQALLQDLDAYVLETLDLLTPASAGLVVSQGNTIICENYYPGRLSTEKTVPVDKNTLWPLFSATKSFAGTVLLSLAAEGKLGLDDPVSQYLPSFAQPGAGPYSRQAVTLRHLASHTSGASLDLAESQLEPRNLDLDFNEVHIVTEPGQVFNYSWLSMLILEKAIEVVAEEDFGETMQERVLDPLGLKQTRYIYQEDPALPMMPTYSGESSQATASYSLSQKGARVSSGLYATARDLNRFSQLWLGDGRFEGQTYFTPALKAEAWKFHGMRDLDKGRYGLLWWLFEQDGGYVASGASLTLSAVVPETQTVVTITRNRPGPSNPAYRYHEDKRQAVLFAKGLGSKN